MNRFHIEIPDIKVTVGAFLSLMTVPEVTIPYVKDVLTIGISILTLIYTTLRIYSEIRKFRRTKRIYKRINSK